MDAFVVGLVGVIVGSLVAAFGVRVFFVLLPVFGFVAGFVIGADAATALFGEGFLATLLSWGLGLAGGIALAIFAGLFFWGAIVVLSGAVGWAAGSGILVGLGVEPGLLTFVAGAAGAAALIILAVAIDAPTIYVAILTSAGGAAWAVAGALLLIGRVELGALSGGVFAVLREYPLAVLAWLALSVVAVGYQLFDARARGQDLRARLDNPIP